MTNCFVHPVISFLFFFFLPILWLPSVSLFHILFSLYLSLCGLVLCGLINIVQDSHFSLICSIRLQYFISNSVLLFTFVFGTHNDPFTSTVSIAFCVQCISGRTYVIIFPSFFCMTLKTVYGREQAVPRYETLLNTTQTFGKRYADNRFCS